ncbi:hypothetical protein EVAR_40958_1 [Eumeta japonica]|uniref:Uncharacterized protein n=1 Tax=Eumeta variegata TaxID=151549 RepID=A0A4C1X3T7_EUMVA|nr:hypothetical protein EVAR_40958_1 [Eumeta japonica]
MTIITLTAYGRTAVVPRATAPTRSWVATELAVREFDSESPFYVNGTAIGTDIVRNNSITAPSRESRASLVQDKASHESLAAFGARIRMLEAGYGARSGRLRRLVKAKADCRCSISGVCRRTRRPDAAHRSPAAHRTRHETLPL